MLGFSLASCGERSGDYQALCEEALDPARDGSLEQSRLRWLKARVDCLRSRDWAAAGRAFEETQFAAHAGRDMQLELHAINDWVATAGVEASAQQAEMRFHNP